MPNCCYLLHDSSVHSKFQCYAIASVLILVNPKYHDTHNLKTFTSKTVNANMENKHVVCFPTKLLSLSPWPFPCPVPEIAIPLHLWVFLSCPLYLCHLSSGWPGSDGHQFLQEDMTKSKKDCNFIRNT